MNNIILNGNNLTRHQVIDVAYNHAKVSIDTSKISNSLDYITSKVEQGKIIYGVTTGFGSNADKLIPKEKTIELQLNLLRSHACGVGNNFSEEIVRAIMVIRLNTLLRGNSGVQLSTVEKLKTMLNDGIHPVIPEQGSVGASGDLCPLSHMALPLIGEGEIVFNNKEYQTEEFLKTEEAKQTEFYKHMFDKEGKLVPLSYKEGLALNNGTTVMTAVGAIALHKAEKLLKVCTLSSALMFESLCARNQSFDYEPIHKARNHSGQIEIAQWLTKLLAGSKLIGITQEEILKTLIEKDKIPNSILDDIKNVVAVEAADEQIQVPALAIDKMKAAGEADLATMLAFAKKKWKPQDSYSIRCFPQVFGASKKAIDHVISVVDNELNASVDNPLIFADDDKVVSGGNFHGQPIALVMDYLKLALAEMGNITERQINKLVDTNTNDCMPSFLIHGTGLNNGLMIPQYAAAAIVSENKVLVHPASADSIPTCENTEDHVSMGTIAARQAVQIAENVEKITAIAIMTGFYALTMRLEQFAEMGMKSNTSETLAPATFEFYEAVRNSNTAFLNPNFLKTDRYLSPEIKAIHLNFGTFKAIADKYI